MLKSLLITRPDHDCTTNYLSKWSKEIIKEGEDKGITVIDLDGDKANRIRVIGTLEKKSPGLVILNGHGNQDSITGHNNDVILEANDRKAVKNKIIYARSCKSAKVLGEKAISHGAQAYLGYDEDFIFLYSRDKVSKPLEDKTATLFLSPSNQIPLSLLKNHCAGEANEKSKALFKKNIDKLLVAGPSSEHYRAIGYLYWDMIHQVCLGDKKATFM
ncbi:MAG: hypothetical protein Q7K98_05390 [Candidatus Omnitrophota bacterium]|nr:hypothetical protein [Candidatus Omnitrophota bacterium]